MGDVTIGELSRCGALAYGDGYRTKRSEHGLPGYRILRVADVIDDRVAPSGEDYVRHDFVNAIGQKTSRAGDVLLTTKGTVGRVAIYPKNAEQVVYSPQLCYFRVLDASVIDSRFLAYWFKSAAFSLQASHRANNTDMAAYINLRDVASLSLDLPSVDEQRAIAEVLMALDDKIFANGRALELLVELEDLQALHLASGSESTARLDSIAKVTKGVSYRSEDLADSDAALVTLKSVGRRGSFEYEGFKPYTGDFKPSQKLAAGDIIVAQTDLTQKAEVVGSAVRTPQVAQYSSLVASLDLAVVRSRGEVSNEYLLGVLRQRPFKRHCLARVSGTTVLHLARGAIESYEFPLINKEAMTAYSDSAAHRFRLADSLVAANITLIRTRDELLPLLMSRKVRVKDAEKRVGGGRVMVSEAEWEDIALERLFEHGWETVNGNQIAPGADGGRSSWDDLILRGPLLAAMRRLNPLVPGGYLEEALARIVAPTSQDAIAENFRLHEIMVHGYRGISYVDSDGIEQNPTIRLVGHRVEDNEFRAVNQVTIRSAEVERRFDVVLYLNGLPVVVVELKKAGARYADLASAHAQLATYLREFPMAFRCCVVSIISDGITARYGTPFTPLNHYAPWNVDDDGRRLEPGTDVADTSLGVELEYLIDGICKQDRFLDLQRDFVAFDEDGGGFVKRVAKSHQYFAVGKAVKATILAARSDGKAGVVWHTQGSGKSMEMELYAHLVAVAPDLKNPTLVVVTDRTELDSQLFETFHRSCLLAETPIQVATRGQLRDELTHRTTGGIYFTTLQKFGLTEAERHGGHEHPLLSDRRNIVVIVDEAHRSHYDQLDGFARHIRAALPKATFIAFTGTPISRADRDTREVFGKDIDVYDLTRAVEDGATVLVHFEPRIITVKLAGDVTEEQLDEAADEATLGLDDVERVRIEKSVAVINAVYGAPARLAALAADIVEHWERRSTAMSAFLSVPGKAFVVGATREICAHLYEEIIALRPEWHDEAVDKGVIKVVYSGSAADKGIVAKHVRPGALTKVVQKRLKNAEDPLQIVIVKDMMLTGFDAPPLHTLYVDRPLKGALLMQTLARVNRTFRGKPDGLLVAYAPLAESLNQALAEYSATDRTEKPVGRDIKEAAALARSLLATLDEICTGFPWRRQLRTDTRSWIRAAVGLTNYLRSPSTPGNRVADGEEPVGQRFRRLASQLARAWALAAGSETLDDDLRGTARFYEEVRVWMGKFDAQERQASGAPVPEEIQRLLSGLVASATATGNIVDIYAAAGLPKPSLSELGSEFTLRAQRAENPHLAIEALRDLLTEEVGKATNHSLVRQRAFSDRIKELMNKYTNQQLTSAEVIAELIEMAKEIAAEGDRGRHFSPPLSKDELVFYDTVSMNESAVALQGEDVLAQIARELVDVMRRDVKTDWMVRDDVRAKLRSSIKRLLVKYKYPPDKQPEAIRLVIEQMEDMAPRYAA